jgi:hypothetical protein
VLLPLKNNTFLPRLFRRMGGNETILAADETIFPLTCRRPETWAH